MDELRTRKWTVGQLLYHFTSIAPRYTSDDEEIHANLRASTARHGYEVVHYRWIEVDVRDTDMDHSVICVFTG